MPRKYVKKSNGPKYAIANIIEAIKRVRITGYSIRKASTENNMPEATLRVHLKKIDDMLMDVTLATDNDLRNVVESTKSHSTVSRKYFS